MTNNPADMPEVIFMHPDMCVFTKADPEFEAYETKYIRADMCETIRQALGAKQWQKIDLEKGDIPEEPKICLMYKPNQKELGHRVSVGTLHKLTGDEEIDKWPPKDDLNYVSHIMVIEPPEVSDD